jgi:hypothetical protein
MRIARPAALVTLALVAVLATGCSSPSRSASPAEVAPTPEVSSASESAAATEPADAGPAVVAESTNDAPSGPAALASPVTCFKHGTCRIGDTGPGGGIVFYDAGSDQEWGRYLEVAPARWSGRIEDPKAVWCDQDASWAIPKSPSREGIGEGLGNAERLFAIQRCAPNTAMGMARDYLGAGLNDWYLPSRDEVLALYDARGKVPGIDLAWLWTSTRSKSTYAYSVMFMNEGKLMSTGFPSMFQVRPIRAF